MKCRFPVNTIAIPRSFAAAITSSSRFEPPGCTLAEAAELANRAAGVVVGKLGTATVELEEL